MKIKEDAYSVAVRRLLVMASLPVLDGFFISFLATGLWQDPGQALAFGLTAFSGGACVVAAMRLEGSLRERFVKALAVYGLLAVLVLVAVHQRLSRGPRPIHDRNPSA